MPACNPMTIDLDPFINLDSSMSSADRKSPLPLLPSQQLSPDQSPFLADSPSASLMIEKPATPPKQLLVSSSTTNSDAPWQGADSKTDHPTQSATLGSFVLVQATSETLPAPPSIQRSSSSTQESSTNEGMTGGIMLGYAGGNGRSSSPGDYSLQDGDSRAPSSLDYSTHAVSVVESNSGGDHQADTFSQCSTRVSDQPDRDNGNNHGLVSNSESVGPLVPTPGLAPAGPENASSPSSLLSALREGSTSQKQDPDVLAISRSSSYGWVEAIEQSG